MERVPRGHVRPGCRCRCDKEHWRWLWLVLLQLWEDRSVKCYFSWILIGSRSRRNQRMVARLLTFCDGSKDCYAGFPIWLLLNHISIMFALDKEKGKGISWLYLKGFFISSGARLIGKSLKMSQKCLKNVSLKMFHLKCLTQMSQKLSHLKMSQGMSHSKGLKNVSLKMSQGMSHLKNLSKMS